MNIFEEMAQSIVSLDSAKAKRLANASIKKNIDPVQSIELGFAPGIQKAGEFYEQGEYFIPQLIRSAEVMKEVLKILQPAILKSGESLPSFGKVVIGTIEGDIHDIGKNLVGAMLDASGFEIIDLGADVPVHLFIENAEKENAELICTSALLTTTMTGQKRLIEYLMQKGLRDKFFVMVGGAPVSKDWAEKIGADGYAENAQQAVKVAKRLVSRTDHG